MRWVESVHDINTYSVMVRFVNLSYLTRAEFL